MLLKEKSFYPHYNNLEVRVAALLHLNRTMGFEAAKSVLL